jgi:dTDP-4-dehydrorhamnose reductase
MGTRMESYSAEVSGDRPLLILGANGQIGSALIQLLGSQGVGITRNEVDCSNMDQFARELSLVLEKYHPSAVINAAAYTQVDRAEQEQSLAFTVNAEAPTKAASMCAALSIPFIHYSTDYVFPGHGNQPWKEEDPTGPLNVYGKSKLEGERGVAAAGGQWLIFRTSWVYDHSGKNFLKTILRLAGERETLRIVSNQWGAPSYASHLAQATLQALKSAQRLGGSDAFPSGIYHLCNQGATSWYGFAEAIVQQARAQLIPLQVKTIEPILTSDYPTPAKRPLNSRLDLSKLKRSFDLTLPPWEVGLKECMKKL